MIKIPQHESTERFREAEAKLHELHGERRRAQEEIDRLTARYMGTKRPTERDRLNAEAEQMLSGSSVSAEPDDIARQIESLNHRLSVLDSAVQLQRRVIDKARTEFSTALCEANRGQYLAVAKKINEAVQTLAEVNQQEAEFFSALEDAGAHSVSFPRLMVSSIGTLANSESGAVRIMQTLHSAAPEIAH